MATPSGTPETPSQEESEAMEWHRVALLDELPEGRATTVTIGRRTLALTHHEGTYGALDNHCPHQGGPLGEGSIEKGLLRCPWHGYDYDPLTGSPPPPFTDAPSCFRTDVRDDGVYVELPADVDRPRSVSDVMVDTMVAWGVDSVFGIVGHSNLGLGDGLRRAEQQGKLKYIGVRHEGAASFAATAYGKLTGRLAACFAIAGPGSTNLLTGLYDAKVDRAPVLALCGQVPSKVRGRGAFQDLDLASAFKDVSAYGATVSTGSDYGELMSLACKTALVERNVAHLIFPDEVQDLPCDGPVGEPEGRVGNRVFAPPAEVVAAAADRIAAASRPLIIVGAGARDGIDEISRLAEQLGAPIATTFKGKGLVSDQEPTSCGVLGRSGTPIASWFMNEADLIIAFGASFSNHTGISPYKPIIQVDHDPMGLGRFHPVELPVLGHVAPAARAISAALAERNVRCHDRRDELAERWAIWRQEKASRVTDDHRQGLSSAAVMAILSGVVPPDAVMPVDVGNNTYSFGRYFEVQHQHVLMSGYLGSIGFAFPAAMGAWAAVGNDRAVVSISGDGGFAQYAMELTTAAKYGMNITHVLLNNQELGKISKEQRAGEYDVWQTSLHNPDFSQMAGICGAKGTRVTSADELRPALEASLAYQGPALVEVMTDALLV